MDVIASLIATPLVQNINKALHQEPLRTIVYGCYWSLLSAIAFPIVVTVLLMRTIYRVGAHYVWPQYSTMYDPNNNNKDNYEMAVIITGCDSGFGKEIALWAAQAGYTVFAGCLHPTTSWPTSDNKDLPGTIIPVAMDVTNDKQVQAVIDQVSTWIKQQQQKDNKNIPSNDASTTASTTKKRVLHCLINNAGIGTGGLVDWLDMSAFYSNIEVNYIGMVRVCKAFLPLFKEQAKHKVHLGGMRIINMTSMAGLVATGTSGLAAYAGSKHAANAFSHILRTELKGFAIQVTTINPSFHGTPLVHTMGDAITKVWDTLNPQTKDEYGQAYFDRLKFLGADLPQMIQWKAEVVIDEVIKCLKMKDTPPELVIGSDSILFLPLLRMFPPWIVDIIMMNHAPATPAAMKS